MADDELRGHACQSVLEDDRICGRPAVVKEFGCYFCAEHASVPTDHDQANPLDEIGTEDEAMAPVEPPTTAKPAPAKPAKSKTTPAVDQTVTDDSDTPQTIASEPAQPSPPPKEPKAKPPVTKSPDPDAPPTVETDTPPSAAMPETSVADVREHKSSDEAGKSDAAERTPPVMPAAESKPEDVKPKASTPEVLEPEAKASQEPKAPVTTSPPPAKAAAPVEPAEQSLEPIDEFVDAMRQRLPEPVTDEAPVAKGKKPTEALAEIENELLDIAARSFRVWEKVRSLQPDKQELELQRFEIKRFHVDLASKQVRSETVPCRDLEDVVGGIARGFKLLEDRPVDDAYDPAATLVMNLGILSGTQFMTGLRTYFHGYSPLKASNAGKPSAMWSAGSGKFGTKLRYLGVEEVLFEGRCAGPMFLHISRPDPQGPPVFKFEDASFLAGRRVNDKVQTLYRRFPDAHFAVIGPAGEAFRQVRYAAVALSTENQLKSGDSKPRFCGRGGMGGIMGSKNLLAIVADIADPPMEKAPPELKEINHEVARGKGSAKLRDKKKGGQGGTWANYDALNPVHAMPEMNFVPTGTDASVPLYRDNVEKEGRFIIKDESCYRCGIACHKNVYNVGRDGKAGRFRAKLDFEPLNLLSSNIGIFDADDACELVALVDEMGMDSISCAVTLSYVMEYNKRHAGNGSTLADGLEYGDFEGARRVIENIGLGRMELLGQGVKRLSEQMKETDYAGHVKGVELPAYLPQTNPGYPWALAGGHMSMRTYLLYVFERETGVDYWVDAIVNRGIQILRDDFLGICKFANLDDKTMCQAIHALAGLEISVEQLQRLVKRVFLRGYRLERRQGFTDDDYVLPKMAHEKYDQIQLPYFNTPEFFEEVKTKVQQTIQQMLVEEDMVDSSI